MLTAQARSVLCRVHTRRVGGGVSLESLVRTISRQSCPAILGGNISVERYSLFCAEPVEIFQFQDGENNPFEKLQQALSSYQLADSDSLGDLPLAGWIGFFAYSLAHYIEKLPRMAQDDIPLPLIHLAFYDKAIVYDHKEQTFSFVVLDYPGQAQTIDRKFHTLQTWLNDDAMAAGATCRSPGQLTTNMTRDYYFNALRKIKQYILDGDVYQINFSQRFECDYTADPVEYFLWQNRHNPAPYAGYLSADDFSIVSASPELFLQIEKDRILTRPIKGTRPRHIGPDSDAYNLSQFEDLLHSPKDQAELMMITDLERNDLARVCVPGTRQVRCLRAIEAWPTLFHAHSEIAGRLPRASDPALVCEILRAVFPGGSITGAPKIRAMEIIDQLEPTGRGIYTGCIGHIGVDFRTTLNIAIRTAVFANHKAYIQTGGGIVADSDPQAEWEEMRLKADALLAAITF